MSSDQSAWFVKANFGAEWGPMSADTLIEMANNGDLARDDLARCNVAADWQPIPTVIDQLRSHSFAANEESQTGDDSFTQPSEDETTLDPAPQFSEQPTPIKRRGGALPGWSNYWVPDSTEPRPLVAHPRLVFEDQNLPIDVASSTTRVEGTSFEIVSEKANEGSPDESRDVPSATDTSAVPCPRMATSRC